MFLFPWFFYWLVYIPLLKSGKYFETLLSTKFCKYFFIHCRNSIIRISKILMWFTNRARPDWACEFLDWTGHPNLQDWSCRTGPNLDRSCRTDRIQTYILINILPTKYRLSILITQDPWIQIWCPKFLEQINKQKKILNFFFKSVKSLASRKESVWCPDSPDFGNLPDFRTRCDVR